MNPDKVSVTLAICALYLLVQCTVNHVTFTKSCDNASVARMMNLLNFVVGLVILSFFVWTVTQK